MSKIVKIKHVKPAKPAKSEAPAAKKCRAAEVGHRSCDCGREGCSFNSPKK